MSIVFEELSVSTTSCPGCQTEQGVSQDVNFQWSVTEFTPSQRSTCGIPSVNTTNSTNPTCRMWFRMQECDAPDRDATGSGGPASSAAPRLKRKDRESTTADDAPSDFHRVRLLFPPARKAHEDTGQDASGGRAVPDTVICLKWRCCQCMLPLLGGEFKVHCAQCAHRRCAECIWTCIRIPG